VKQTTKLAIALHNTAPVIDIYIKLFSEFHLLK